MTSTRTRRFLSVQPVCDGGGSEHALIGMIRQLHAAGWECHVAVPGHARLAEEYAAAGAVLHVVPMDHLSTTGGALRWVRYAARWPVTVVRLARLCRRLGVTVLHSNSLHEWHGWAAARFAGIPHVWHAREIVFQSALALGVERFLARSFSRQVVAVSGAVARQLHLGNVVVVTDEADPDLFTPERAGRFRGRVGIADGVPLVGSVGRIDTWKGIEVLLDSFTEIRSARPDAELVVAGPAVPGKELYARGLAERAAGMRGVHWVGPRSDVPDLLADLDVFVLASTEAEPFGLVVVEALTSGVPVVATAGGGPLEILAHGGGILVEPGDAGSLACAVVDLLPEGASAAAARRSREPLRRPGAPGFASLFGALAEDQRAAPATSR